MGGTHILFSPTRQILLISNTRKGGIAVYDIKKFQVIKSLEVSSIFVITYLLPLKISIGQEIKQIALSETENVLIAGSFNGSLKFIELQKYEMINEVTMRQGNFLLITIDTYNNEF